MRNVVTEVTCDLCGEKIKRENRGPVSRVEGLFTLEGLPDSISERLWMPDICDKCGIELMRYIQTSYPKRRRAECTK
jgi:hypothetical protein